MNKIYKVVWNKARNCYVVASEFAKNHQTGSSRIKAASVAAVMAATMLTIGTGVIYAADVTDTGVKESKETILFDNTTGETTMLNDPNLKHDRPGSWVHGHTAECGELTYNTTLTIGDINKVVDKLVDNDTLLYNQGIQKVTMNNGTISLIRNDNTSVTNSIALTGNGGKNGQDTAVTVAVGNESQTFKTGSVVTAKTDTTGNATGFTINGKSYDIKAGKTYTAGANVTIADDGTISARDTTYSAGDNVKIDDKNKISVDLSKYAKSDDVAVVYQDNDKNKSLHSTNAGTVGSSSIALGKAATTGMSSVALGDQTKATGESSTAIGVKAEATALDSIAIGGKAKATGVDSIAIGSDTTATKQYSVAIGDDIHFTGDSATAVGQQAHATGDYSTALGAMTNVDGAWNYQHPGEWRKSGTMSTAIGYGSGSWGDYSTAIGGGYATAEGQFATAIGTSSQATAENAVALGGAAKANVYGGVALGTSSVADRAAGKRGAFAPNDTIATDKTWNATAGAVSVGDNQNITRQITNVAAGSEDTDAVNVAQLKKAADSAKTTVVAGKNIKVDADTKKDGHTEYNVSLDDDITLGDKASNEFVTVSGTKGTIWAGHSVSAGTVIMDGDSGTITGLTNTTWNGTTDNLSRAATEGQLKQVADAATSNDKRLVQNPNDSDGSYQVKENGDVTLRVEDSNKNGYNVTIKDVASKAELDKVKTDVGNVDGFHDEIKNKDTNGKPTHTSVVDAVNNLDTKVNTIQSDVTKATEEAKKHSSVSTGNGLDLDVTDNNGQKDYKVSLKDDFTLGGKDGHTGSIEFKGSEGNITASGTLTANAVSVGNTSISDTGLQIGNKTSLTEDALTIGGNTYITDKGIDANQQKISNVADGDISKDSKDAVNGSQLYATNEAIANNYNNITNLNGRISNLDNRVNKVGAGAAALAALHPLDFDPDAKWDFAAGYGNYRGANAAAVGAYYRPNEDTMFSVGGTFGNGENMVNAGVSFKLGSGSSHVSTSRVAMAKEIKELRGELEAMKSAMLDANAGKKIDTSKLQLFPDVPQNHWAYEYVAQLAGNGMIEGYPDGNFAGDRPMTRYEFAAILYRAMTKGAVLSDKLLSEFSHELEYFTVDTIAKDKAGNPTIQRVRTVKENKNK